MSTASQCFEPSDTPMTNLAKLQSLSLDDKILYSTVKIKEFHIATKRMTDLKRWTRPQIFFSTDFEHYHQGGKRNVSV